MADAGMTRVPARAVTSLLADSFVAAGLPDADAARCAELMTEADLTGAEGHGILRLPQYVRRLKARGFNAHPNITVTKSAPATALVDGDNGMGHLVMTRAANAAIAMARDTGVAWVGVRRSNHAGPAGLYAEMPTAHGMIGFYAAVANANHMATWGGTDLLLGTNPLAIGVPSGAGPLVLDMATSIVAYGTVKKYALRGLTMPEGWFVKPETGEPITDPNRSGEGILLPMGEYKGAGLALMLGLLGGVLNGAAFGRDVVDFNADDSSETNTGHFMVAIDIARFLPLATFTAEVDRHVRDFRQSKRLPGVDEIRLPGDRRAQCRAERLRDGVPIAPALLAQLDKLAAELKIKPLRDKSMMLRPGTFGLTLLLSLLTGLGPMTMDMYLPSLPAIGQALGASTVQVQLTISSYLIGFAAGQIVYGPVSDRVGRRPVILAALVLYGVATIVCALAQSIEVLIAVRFVQALGGAGCIVLARAAVRDLYSGVRAGRELSLMGSITAFAPIVAPAIGGVLQTAFGWRASFVLLVVFALVAGSAAALLLPETLRQRASGPFSLAAMGGLYRSVLAHRGFLANLGILVASFVGLFAWIAGAPFVMQDLYGLTPVVFGMTYAAGAAGYMVGAYTASRFVMRLGLDRTIGIGAVVMAFGGLAMAAAIALGLAHVGWLVGTMTIYLAGMGLVLPQTQAGALTPFPDRAGTASSLLGFAQQTSAAIAAVAIGHYLGRSAWPVAGTIAVMGVLALLIWALTRAVRTAPMFNA